MKGYAVFYGPIIAGVKNTDGKLAIYDTQQKAEQYCRVLKEARHYETRMAIVEITEIKSIQDPTK